MTKLTTFPSPAPMDDDLLSRLTTELNAQQQLWLSGYLYGLQAAQAGIVMPSRPAPEDRPGRPPAEPLALTILYGSQTGNSKSVAGKLAGLAQAEGFSANLGDMNDYAVRQLKSEKLLVIIVSTQGEGEPPTAAEELHRFLQSPRAPKLADLQFAVLALGDRSYTHFCQTGREFDERLAALGARRLLGRVDCDIDFQETAANWSRELLLKLHSLNGSGAGSGTQPTQRLAATPLAVAYDRKNPFESTILEKIQLNGRGSTRETWHLELSLEGSGLSYEPGDSLGIMPENSEELVEAVLRAAGVSGDTEVDFQGEKGTLSAILREKAELSTIHREVIARLAASTQSSRLQQLADDPIAFKEYAYGRDVADLLREFPIPFDPLAFPHLLRRLQPRLYSISSAPSAFPDEAHLTICAVRYNAFNRDKHGVASTFVADRLSAGQTARVFVERNEYFKLPKDGSTPIIMLGAGTGIAPFRAFVQERRVTGAGGKNWLFFGNPNFTTDFLYQAEWQQSLKKGGLDRLSVAFSRDQAEKIYVWHRLLENGRDIYDWLQNGAVFYVCGDRSRLAPDVQKALQTIFREHGNLSKEESTEYFKKLKKERRYLEDVY